MTIAEYTTWKMGFFHQQIMLLEKNKKLFEAKVAIRKMYDMNYMTAYSDETDNLESMSLDEMMEEIEQFENDFTKEELGPLMETSMEADAYGNYDGGAEIEGIHLRVHYNLPSNELQYKTKSRELFRKALGDKIRPSDIPVHIQSIVDCKAIEMFEAEELTYKGLQKIAFGSCDL